MKQHTSIAALAIAAWMAVPAVHAANDNGSPSARQHYQQESAACMRLRADQRPDCLSEASTRLAQTRPTPAAESSDALAANALKRCEPLPGDLRMDCEARMRGEGTVSGSVEGGGLYRELVTTVVEPQPESSGTTSGSTPAKP